jgi:hydrogenase maturation protein HypF
MLEMPVGRRLLVRGKVQGVGFRPYVFRLARAHGLAGTVSNVKGGVAITVEGSVASVTAFIDALRPGAPSVARIDEMLVETVAPNGAEAFVIGGSADSGEPTTQLPPDLPVCEECLGELRDQTNRRYRYPYITCTACGPRFSLCTGFPYDRCRTTMHDWRMCDECSREFGDPADRRFHAQPIACARCGPQYRLAVAGRTVAVGADAFTECARLVRDGRIVAVKGVGGYHLACDAANAASIASLRARKHRDAKPFALMARDLDTASRVVHLSPAHAALLTSIERPIVLAPPAVALPGVAPHQARLGLMLPYTPAHHLLFDAGAPPVLVMTSGNRSGEPMVFGDDDAVERLEGIADALLIGERRIARRVDDSVVTTAAAGTIVLRRARGYAPHVVARLPACDGPILALGADLKNAVTLVVDGKAIVSQHIGDLDQFDAFVAFEETIRDLLDTYEVDRDRLVVVHDGHPEYRSTQYAATLGARRLAVQHHRSHLASVLAERDALDTRVVGVVFDGAGFGDDGTIWGGEIFTGSVDTGFERVAHSRPAVLPGGDASARFPVQAAAGFLSALPGIPSLVDPPFSFPARYDQARRLVDAKVRAFATTSIGRLFDVVAALLGFNGAISFEGEAAMWLEALASSTADVAPIPLPFRQRALDFEPALRAVIDLRMKGSDAAAIARGFHVALARAAGEAVQELRHGHRVDAVVASGGVFQNVLLLDAFHACVDGLGLPLWVNHDVPPGDGGVSLGQAAIASTMLRRQRHC